MARYWWILITSWFGTVSLQYISTGDDQAAAIFHQASFAVNRPSTENTPTPEFDTNTILVDEDSSLEEYGGKEGKRIAQSQTDKDDRWVPNLIDKDKTQYYMANEIRINKLSAKNAHERHKKSDEDSFEKRDDEITDFYKRSFNPWGGKRDKKTIEHAWTWKRDSQSESMPKRVRFSPWGGKRSGQIFYKSGLKGSKIIFSATAPEFIKQLSGSAMIGHGIQFAPSFGKKHPIEILSVNQAKGTSLPSLPLTKYIDTAPPRLFNPTMSFAGGFLKKDGKRKMKFNAWGGKRSAPLIGPIWTAHTFKPENIDAFLLIRNMAALNQRYGSSSV